MAGYKTAKKYTKTPESNKNLRIDTYEGVMNTIDQNSRNSIKQLRNVTSAMTQAISSHRNANTAYGVREQAIGKIKEHQDVVTQTLKNTFIFPQFKQAVENVKREEIDTNWPGMNHHMNKKIVVGPGMGQNGQIFNALYDIIHHGKQLIRDPKNNNKIIRENNNVQQVYHSNPSVTTKHSGYIHSFANIKTRDEKGKEHNFLVTHQYDEHGKYARSVVTPDETMSGYKGLHDVNQRSRITKESTGESVGLQHKRWMSQNEGKKPYWEFNLKGKKLQFIQHYIS